MTSNNTVPNANTVATGSAGAGATSAPLSNLTPITTYRAYVRSVCSTTDKSAWSSPVIFTTICVPVSSLPWTENFDSMTNIGTGILPNCWSISGGSATRSTYTTQDDSSQIYNNPQSNPNFVTIYYPYNNPTYLWTSGFNLTAGQSYDFSFYWVGDGYSGWDADGYVNTSANETGATALGSIVGQSTTTGSTYTKQTFTYIPATSGTYYFAVKTNCTTFDPYYLGYDDFKVEATPTCAEPTGLAVTSITSNSVSASWNGPATAPGNGYEYYYSTSTTAPSANTVASGTSPSASATIGNLSPNTLYHLYVRSVCSASDKSSWTLATNFTTACVAANPNYTMNFDGNTNNCLSIINPGTGNAWTIDVTPTDVTNGTFTGNVMKYGYNSSDAANTWFFTQGISLNAGTTYSLSYLYANNSDMYVEKMLVAAGTSPTAAAMTTVINDHSAITGGAQNSSNNNSFTPATTGVYYFGFKAYSDANQYNLYVDDIQIISGILATAETKKVENNIQVYPNPFTDVLNIKDAEKIQSASVSDFNGRIVKRFDKVDFTLRMGDLTSGAYLLILKMKDGSQQTQKIIKK